MSTLRALTRNLLGSLWFGACASALAQPAAPADAHQRGLQAYQRGDVAGALAVLQPAARAGDAASQALLGFLLDRSGEDAEAVRQYGEAARQGNADGHYGLAGMLLTGRGVAKDEKAAFEHFSKAAALGHRHAAEIVATAWIRRQMGADPEADPAPGRAAVARAAEQGHLPSAEFLAQAYGSGQFGLPVDPAQATRWSNQARAWRQERAVASRPAK